MSKPKWTSDYDHPERNSHIIPTSLDEATELFMQKVDSVRPNISATLDQMESGNDIGLRTSMDRASNFVHYSDDCEMVDYLTFDHQSNLVHCSDMI